MLEKAKKKLAKLEPSKDKNQEKITKIFDKLRADLLKNLEARQSKVMEQMATMSADQQEAVIAFWTEMSQLFTEILEWIGRMFDRMVVMIRSGHRLDKKANSEFFQSIVDHFKRMFDPDLSNKELGIEEMDHDGKPVGNKQTGNAMDPNHAVAGGSTTEKVNIILYLFFSR